VEESDKHQLEGLLQARSEDMRQGRVRQRRRPMADPPLEPPAPGDSRDATATRACRECGRQIAPRRLAALPRATRCLDCQRASEQAATPS
jgi:hypothetical protein